MNTLTRIGLIICSYFVGCGTMGYYLTRWRTGQDVRALGSGSVGATNVGRTLGRTGFVITFVFDFMKGAIIVIAARRMQAIPLEMTACMVAVVVGHIWPVQLGFRGGKGIAVSLGVICAYNIEIALILVFLFVLLYLMSRKFILSGMFTCAIAPLCAVLVGASHAALMAITLMAVFIIFAHRQNILEDISRIRPLRQPEKDSLFLTKKQAEP
jgi:glycerol-3-phosphate acyltransferase PlsY